MRHRPTTTVLVVLLVMWAIGTAIGDDDPAEGPSTSAVGDGDVGIDGGTPAEKQGRSDRRDRPASGHSSPHLKAPRSAADPEPRTERSRFLVTRVIDGDTIELGNGQTVRLAGIDTPEVGECGFEPSSALLAGLVLGREVTLVESDEDVDQYGRLLRYVDIGTMDAGLRLIKRGLAVARYDSRDGYGYHPRERIYVSADASSTNLGCVRAVPLVGGGGGGTGSCAPGYSPCIRPYPPDLDCPDVDGPITVTGSDPHGLDADGDGVACEW